MAAWRWAKIQGGTGEFYFLPYNFLFEKNYRNKCENII